MATSEQTFYWWKKQYAGLDSGQARQLKQLHDENARLKKIVAELSLDKALLADALKNVVKPDYKSQIVNYFKAKYPVS